MMPVHNLLTIKRLLLWDKLAMNTTLMSWKSYAEYWDELVGLFLGPYNTINIHV